LLTKGSVTDFIVCRRKNNFNYLAADSHRWTQIHLNMNLTPFGRTF